MTLDHILADEIALCAINHGELYRSRIVPIIANLKRKVRKGTYDPKLALKLWMYAADDMVRIYSVDQMGLRVPTLTILPPAGRLIVAEALADHFADEIF
jgi:hypothetical protein